jgi:hypothetical protein
MGSNLVHHPLAVASVCDRRLHCPVFNGAHRDAATRFYLSIRSQNVAGAVHESAKRVLALFFLAGLMQVTSLGFNLDGQTDILWHHNRRGETAVWLMNGTNFSTAAWITNDLDSGWQIAATADFNRDGQTDLFWRNPATGQNAIWLMQTTNRIGRNAVEMGSTDFYVAGAGDFDGDGFSDILWCHKSKDVAAVWFMKGTNWSGQIGWLPNRKDWYWQAAATGDFNNDGFADIVWRHQGNGRNAIWFMEGTNLVRSVEIKPESDLGNHLIGTGQFNPLGNTDLVWRHTNGLNSIWLMSGTNFLRSARLPTQTDTNWVIVGTGGYSTSRLLGATSTVSPPSITLSWRYGAAGRTVIQRKTPAASTWTNLANSSVSPRFTDTNVQVGERYEYEVDGGYILTAIHAAPVENRGKVILIVEQTAAKALAADLTRLAVNLVGDGWTVIRTNVPRHDDSHWPENTNRIAAIKSFVTNVYKADPAGTRAVFIIGHVPIPYSGFHNPDGHGGRALPADSYYGDIDGIYTDARLNNASLIDPPEPRHENRIGDGKWDQNRYPAKLALAVGRIDFAKMPVFSKKSEMDLLRQYLNKDDRYRHHELVAADRVTVGGFLSPAPMNRRLFQQALKNGSRYFGLAPGWITEGDVFQSTGDSALLGLIGGWGLPFRIQGADGGFHTSQDMANQAREPRVCFALLYGSYLVDWEYPNNLMRAYLGTANFGLGAMWLLSAPNGHLELSLEQLALGETIGSGFLRTMNHDVNGRANFTFNAFLGDPTLRLQILAPAKNLTASGRRNVTLTWTGSPETDQYFVYRSANGLDGPWKRLTTGPIMGNRFTDESSPSGQKLYQVRAAKLTVTGSGSFTNLSQGVFRSVN